MVLPLAADSVTVALGIAGPLLGVLVGGGVTYLSQTKLEQRRETRANKAEEEQRTRQEREQAIAAYANAWGVKAEITRRTGYARGWLGNEIALEELAVVAAPMDVWEANRTLFGDVLSSAAWLDLVKAVELFNAKWDRLIAIARRPGPMTVTEKRRFLDELQSCSEELIEMDPEVNGALRSLFALG